MIPLHLGALHPVEQAVTIALAFGPFVVLGIVILLRRRAEDAEDAEDAEGAEGAEREAQSDAAGAGVEAADRGVAPPEAPSG